MDDNAPQIQDSFSITSHLKVQANSFCLTGGHTAVHIPHSPKELEVCSKVQLVADNPCLLRSDIGNCYQMPCHTNSGQ